MRDLERRRGLARLSGRAAATLVVLVLAACGGSGGGGGGPAAPGAPPAAPPAASAFTVTLTAAGATPKELRVPVGSRVTFVNQDSRSHQMMSAPHPMHTDCPAINEVGNIDRGETKVTGAFTVAKDCGFHDNLRDGDATLRGVILVGDAERDPNYGY
jgi:plastocyanin